MRTLTLSDYMHQALYGPDGYYRTHMPIGAQGDFTTAPEISQLFGEAIGAWVWSQWEAMGRPNPVQLVECGPGRGVLMQDVLRTLSADSECLQALRVVMLEVSERLQTLQQQVLKDTVVPIVWAKDVSTLEALPTIFIGNEFLDAFPVDHYKYAQGRWSRKYVQMSATEAPEYLWQEEQPPSAFFEFFYRPTPAAEETIWEYSPGQVRWLTQWSTQAQGFPVAALWVDYGYLQRGPGETLQGVQGHQYAHPLKDFGRVDLSAHVNFEALSHLMQSLGFRTSRLQTQQAFLGEMGIALRIQKLSESASDVQKRALYEAVERLMAPQYMGTLFKVWGVERIHQFS